MINEKYKQTSVYSISSGIELTHLKTQNSYYKNRNSCPSIIGEVEGHHSISNRSSCDTLTQLDKVTSSNNQKNITKISIAILIIFMVCQLPRGILLTKCGLDYEPLYPHFANCLQNIDHDHALDISGEWLHIRMGLKWAFKRKKNISKLFLCSNCAINSKST